MPQLPPMSSKILPGRLMKIKTSSGSKPCGSSAAKSSGCHSSWNEVGDGQHCVRPLAESSQCGLFVPIPVSPFENTFPKQTWPHWARLYISFCSSKQGASLWFVFCEGVLSQDTTTDLHKTTTKQTQTSNNMPHAYKYWNWLIASPHYLQVI